MSVYMCIYIYIHKLKAAFWLQPVYYCCNPFAIQKTIPSVLYLCTWLGEEGGMESPLRCSGSWEPEAPWCNSQSWGTHWNPGSHPRAASGASARFSGQSDWHLPLWAEAGDTALPKPLGREGLSWPGSDGEPESSNMSLKKTVWRKQFWEACCV